MQALIENARRILDTAVEAERTGQNASDWTFFVGPEGGSKSSPGLKHPRFTHLESRREYGLAIAPRWRRDSRGGRSPLERCRLETDAPARAARILLGSGPLYQFADAA